jgi:hypothetical protein
MCRAIPVLVAFATLSPGCVPVTNPVGDIEKAEPDNALVGTWVSTKNPSDIVRFEVREVKGVPKGMMPMTALGTSPERDPYWFFVATVGKEKFGNLCMDHGGGKKEVLPDFGAPGAYEHWAGSRARFYVVFRYSTGKDEITLNFGDEKAYQAVGREARLKEPKDAPFETPVGWLANYIEKNGSDKIFPADKDIKFERKK